MYLYIVYVSVCSSRGLVGGWVSGGGVWNLTFDTKSKYERIVRFKPCVYLAYFRSYGHLKIVKYIAMYQKFTFKMARTPWKMHL